MSLILLCSILIVLITVTIALLSYLQSMEILSKNRVLIFTVCALTLILSAITATKETLTYLKNEKVTKEVTIEYLSGNGRSIPLPNRFVFDKEIEKYKLKQKSKILNASAYFEAGMADLFNGNFNHAKRNFYLSNQSFETISAILGLTSSNYYIGLLDTAIAYAATGISISNEKGIKQYLSFFYEIQGNCYAEKGNYEKAISSIELSFKFSSLKNKKLNKIKLNNFKVYQHLLDGNCTKAIKLSKEALEIAQSENASPLLYSSIFNNLGTAYSDCKMLDSAEFYLRKSIDINNTKLKGVNNCLYEMANFGIVIYRKGKLQSAENIFRFILNQSIQSNQLDLMQNSFHWLAIIYLEKSKYNDALESFFKANILANQLSLSPLKKAEALQGIGTTFIFLGHKDSSLIYLDSAVNMYQVAQRSDRIDLCKQLKAYEVE